MPCSYNFSSDDDDERYNPHYDQSIVFCENPQCDIYYHKSKIGSYIYQCSNGCGATYCPTCNKIGGFLVAEKKNGKFLCIECIKELKK